MSLSKKEITARKAKRLENATKKVHGLLRLLLSL
jgi:hypothetical protein